MSQSQSSLQRDLLTNAQFRAGFDTATKLAVQFLRDRPEWQQREPTSRPPAYFWGDELERGAHVPD